MNLEKTFCDLSALIQDSFMATKQLGDYDLLRPLGEGLFGPSFLAEQRFMKRRFVLKLLPNELFEDSETMEAIREEIYLLTKLHHPFIVPIHSVFRHEERYFLALSFVDDEMGEPAITLETLLKQTKEPLEERLLFSILQQIAKALDYAHTIALDQRALSHGALRPNNILLTVRGGEYRAVLSGFGMVRIFGIQGYLQRLFLRERERDSSYGALHGALTFLAPEQKQGIDPFPTSPESDRFAFGVLAYLALTSSLPHGFFPLPSELRPELCYDWDSLIRYCLHPDPMRRPTALTPLIEAIEQKTSFENPPHQSRGERFFSTQQRTLSDIQPTAMVLIPKGRFERGSMNGPRDEAPRHIVELDSFYIDIHPVTNEQFILFLISLIEKEGEEDHRDLIQLRDSRIRRKAGSLEIEPGYHNHPVVGVTWYGSLRYAKWVGKRLPTEAEWEVVASGAGANYPYPTGTTIDKASANYFGTDTTEVMLYPPSHLGVYDLAGNVYEWCNDWYDYNYYEKSANEPINPQGPEQGVYRVLKGGCWKSLQEDLRSSRRQRNTPGNGNRTYGFRCAKNSS